MLFLTSTSDKIQVITSAAGIVSIHASYSDYNASATPQVSIGRLNSHVTTAATTDVVPAPAASTARSLKSLKISNDSATVTNTITVQHTDGTTVSIFDSVTLAPNERFAYEEGTGFRIFDAQGREKQQSAQSYPGNSNTADVVANAADTYLTGSSIAIPPSRLQGGTNFRWVFRMTKSAAGVAAATFNVRTGTAGAVGDTSRALFTLGAQTAVTDDGYATIDGNFRVVGTSAVFNGLLRFEHTNASTGLESTLGAGLPKRLLTLSSAFDVSPAGTIIGVSCNPGASGVWTFQLVEVAAAGLIA